MFISEAPESPKGSAAPEDAEGSSVLKLVMVGSSVFLALIVTTGWTWRWNVSRRKGGAESEADVQVLRGVATFYVPAQFFQTCY